MLTRRLGLELGRRGPRAASARSLSETCLIHQVFDDHTSVIMAKLAIADLPPQFPPYYETRSHSQPVDHFNAINGDRFEQRYLLNATHWGGPGSPILFYTGAEGSGVTAIFSHSGYVLSLAQSLRAMVVDVVVVVVVGPYYSCPLSFVVAFRIG